MRVQRVQTRAFPMVNLWERVPTLDISQYSEIVKKYRDPRGGHAEEGSHGAEDEVITFDSASHSLTESEHHGKPKRDRTLMGDIFQQFQHDHFVPQNGVQEYKRLLEGRRTA